MLFFFSFLPVNIGYRADRTVESSFLSTLLAQSGLPTVLVATLLINNERKPTTVAADE